MSWNACIVSSASGLESITLSASSSANVASGYGFATSSVNFGNISLFDDCVDDLLYEVDLSYSIDVSSPDFVRLARCFLVDVDGDEIKNYLGAFKNSSSGSSHAKQHNFSLSDVFYIKGADLDNLNLAFNYVVFSNYNVSKFNLDFVLDININSVTPLSASESADYESGYNAGYSDGLLDGEASVDTDGIYNDGYSDGFADGETSVDTDGIYDDGYSSGFADGEASVDTDGIYDDGYSDGFADGEASVDTDAIYSDAYKAGYEAGLIDGSDDTLKEGKTLVSSINDSFTIPGQIMNNYYSQYITEPAVSFVTGSASHTIELPMSSYFDVGKDYLVDLRLVSAENKNETYSVTIGEYLGHSIYPSPRFTLSGPGLNMNSMGESIYSPTQTGTFKLSVSVPADFSILSTYYEGIDSEYVTMPSYGNAIGQLNWDSEISYIIDIYEVEIIEEIDYLRDQSNKLNDLNNTQQESLDVSKETAETTKNMFSSMKEFFGSFFDNIINSFIRLFVPEDTYFADYFDRLNSFFEEKFGFLYQPIGFFVDIVNAFLGDWGDYSLVFPGFSWEGQEVWPDIEFSFDDTVSAFPKVFEYIRLATNISILVALINLIYKKYEEVMRN